MSNQYARLMKEGQKLPPEAKGLDGRLVPFFPTDDMQDFVRTLAGNGVAHQLIAKLLKISRATLQKRFKEELAEGRATVTAHMGAALVREGIAGNVAAIRFWLAARGGEEWAMAKANLAALDALNSQDDEDNVHFYMPSNGRDEPEVLDDGDGPVIDGTATEAA
jgi:hypothetical protein